MRIFLPEPDDWEQSIQSWIVYRVVDHYIDLVKKLQGYQRNCVTYNMRLTYWSFLSLFEDDIMARKKSNGSVTDNGRNNDRGKGSDVKWVWANCRLSDEDISALEGDGSTLEYLATSLIALGADGFGFSCKPVDEGKSHNCTIYRPDFPNHGTTIGVSAFGGNLRDAILTCLYKLDNYCGGDFSSAEYENDTTGAKPRFR